MAMSYTILLDEANTSGIVRTNPSLFLLDMSSELVSYYLLGSMSRMYCFQK
jgi:hypothetical protein